MLADVEVHTCMRHVAEDDRSRRWRIFSVSTILTGSVSMGQQALWTAVPTVNGQDRKQVQQHSAILRKYWKFYGKTNKHGGTVRKDHTACEFVSFWNHNGRFFDEYFRSATMTIEHKYDEGSVLFGKKIDWFNIPRVVI